MKVQIKKSIKQNKKLMAIFFNEENHKIKTIHFGAKGMSDYTSHKDKQRKLRYLNRHKKNEYWENPMTAGSLSRYILWNKPTLKASINDYQKRFNLKSYNSKKKKKRTIKI